MTSVTKVTSTLLMPTVSCMLLVVLAVVLLTMPMARPLMPTPIALWASGLLALGTRTPVTMRAVGVVTTSVASRRPVKNLTRDRLLLFSTSMQVVSMLLVTRVTLLTTTASSLDLATWVTQGPIASGVLARLMKTSVAMSAALVLEMPTIWATV